MERDDTNVVLSCEEIREQVDRLYQKSDLEILRIMGDFLIWMRKEEQNEEA